MLRPFHIALATLVSVLSGRSGQADIQPCDATHTLKACVDLARANGTGTVLLRPSATSNVFNVDSMVTLPSNTTLRCEANVTIRQAGADTALIRFDNEQNTVIQDCIFDGSSDTVAALVFANMTGVRISGNTFQHFNLRAVSSYPIGGGWNDVEIDHNLFTSAGQPDSTVKVISVKALELTAQNGDNTGSNNVRVHHNVCNNAAQLAGCFTFNASSAQPLKQLSVTDNVIYFGSGAHENLAIELFPADVGTLDFDQAIQQFTIANNIITANPGSQHSFCISTWGSRGVISGNTLSNCQANGIEVIASNTAVIGNTLSYAGSIVWNSARVSRSNVVIMGNSIYKSTNAAISLYVSEGGRLADGIVSGNVIQNPDSDGIRLQAQPGDSIRDIRIDHNIVDAPNMVSGIHTMGSISQARIESNRLVNIAGSGFKLEGGSQLTLRFNNFSGSGKFNPDSVGVIRRAENIKNGVCCF